MLFNNYKDKTQQKIKETKPTIKYNKQRSNCANDQPVVHTEELEQGGLGKEFVECNTQTKTKATIKQTRRRMQKTNKRAIDQPVVHAEEPEQGGLCCRGQMGRTPVKYICFILR